jgi:NitT/TauT family transport system substrate-binding protein
VRKGSRIRNERDFGGRTIATPQLGNTQDVAARVWLAERKYKLKEQGGNVSVLPLANPDQLAMFQRKQIDGAWTVEPWLARLELEGGGRLFLDEKKLWPDGRYVTTHLIVSREFLAANPDIVRRLIEAHVAVTQSINADEAAAGRTINEQIAQETGKPLPQPVIERALGRIEYTWDPITASLRRGAQAAHEIGFLREPPKLEGLYSLHTLNAVLREQGLPEVSAE